MSGFTLICCVVNTGDAEKAIKYAKKYGIKNGIISIGKGIVQSHLLQLLGLDEVRKEVVRMIIKDDMTPEALLSISHGMQLHKPNHGIAFSMPICELIGSTNETENNSEIVEVKNKMYNIIYVVVEKGNAEDVIDAATEAGARGATILNARSAGIGEEQTFFKMKIAPEKEEIFILTKTETKDAIVTAIKKCIKTDEPGHDIMFVMEVNEAYGLR
jgi:nitrogen regulatory protein PII